MTTNNIYQKPILNNDSEKSALSGTDKSNWQGVTTVIKENFGFVNKNRKILALGNAIDAAFRESDKIMTLKYAQSVASVTYQQIKSYLLKGDKNIAFDEKLEKEFKPNFTLYFKRSDLSFSKLLLESEELGIKKEDSIAAIGFLMAYVDRFAEQPFRNYIKNNSPSIFSGANQNKSEETLEHSPEVASHRKNSPAKSGGRGR